MLNPFPYLLSFTAFSPFLIRIAVGLYLLIAARHAWENRGAIVAELLPMLRSLSWPKLYAIVAVEVLSALALIAGFYTQIGAILGLVVFLGLVLSLRRLPSLSPWTRSVPLLLALLCVTLLLTGAGAFAFDYPF